MLIRIMSKTLLLLQNEPTFVAQACAQLYLFSFYGGDDFVDSQIFARRSIPKTDSELKKLFCCIEFIKVVLILADTVKQLFDCSLPAHHDLTNVFCLILQGLQTTQDTQPIHTSGDISRNQKEYVCCFHLFPVHFHQSFLEREKINFSISQSN